MLRESPIPWKLNRGEEVSVDLGCSPSSPPHPPPGGGSATAADGDELLRKEVIQPQVLLQLPCYDFTPIAEHTMGGCFPRVSAPTSGTTDFRDVTGGVYKARERIHPSMLIWDY
jgi:hypothetical protein